MDCILWPRGCFTSGYGALSVRGKMRLAHRVAYCDYHGLDLEGIKGKIVMHTCDTRSCVNPDHLRLGTVQDNVRDMLSKGRDRVVGERNGRARLSTDQVLSIRSDSRPQSVLAYEYGVGQQHISRLKGRKRWAHVKTGDARHIRARYAVRAYL